MLERGFATALMTNVHHAYCEQLIVDALDSSSAR